MDDVLCHTARHFLVIVEREFGRSARYEQLIHFDVGRSCELTAAERDELYRIVHSPDELIQLEPIEGAVETLEQWRLRGFEIAIVTGRPPETHEASVAWLGEHRVPYDSFTVVNKYARFPTENSAAIGLNELASRKFCWAVEDSLPIAEFLATRMRLPVALMDRPWNQNDASDHERIARYSDWRSVAAAYCQLPLDSQ
jgi:beta-phosphoglucomutase-like phosphatase (HAD superfamily)